MCQPDIIWRRGLGTVSGKLLPFHEPTAYLQVAVRHLPDSPDQGQRVTDESLLLRCIGVRDKVFHCILLAHPCTYHLARATNCRPFSLAPAYSYFTLSTDVYRNVTTPSAPLQPSSHSQTHESAQRHAATRTASL